MKLRETWEGVTRRAADKPIVVEVAHQHRAPLLIRHGFSRLAIVEQSACLKAEYATRRPRSPREMVLRGWNWRSSSPVPADTTRAGGYSYSCRAHRALRRLGSRRPSRCGSFCGKTPSRSRARFFPYRTPPTLCHTTRRPPSGVVPDRCRLADQTTFCSGSRNTVLSPASRTASRITRRLVVIGNGSYYRAYPVATSGLVEIAEDLPSNRYSRDG